MNTAWPEVSLGDACELKYGKSLPKGKRSGEGFGVYGSNGEVGRHRECLTSGTTLVVGRKGSFGEVTYSQEPCWPIDTTYFVDETATEADLRWLYYRMKALPLTQLNRAAAIPGLNREDAYALRMLLPPLDEQRRIAAVLDAADALRVKHRQALAKLGELAQAIYVELFGTPFEDRWSSSPLEDLCEGIYDCPHSTPVWADQGLICLRTSNLGLGRWVWSDTRYVSAETYEERSKRAYLEPGDIVLSREGTVGVAALVQDGMQMCMGQRLVQLRPAGDSSPRFLLDTLLFLLDPTRIGRVMAGSTAKHLNVRELRRLSVPTPPTDRQQEYESRVEQVDELRHVAERELQVLDALFGSLQQRAFRGEL